MLQMITGVRKCYLRRKSSHVLMLPLHSTIITQIWVFQTRKLLHMTQLKIQNYHFSPCIFSLFLHCLVYLVSFCIQYIHISNLLLTDEKFASCIQDNCYKPHNQVKNFSRTCLFKTMII